MQTAPWHAPRSSCEFPSKTDSPKYKLSHSQLVYVGNCNELGLLTRVVQASETFQALRPVFDTSAQITDEEIDLYLAMVQEMAQISESQNSRLLVAFIRASEASLAESSWSNERIVASLQAHADAVIDLTLAPSAETIPLKYKIHQTDDHPSALANEERPRCSRKQLMRWANCHPCVCEYVRNAPNDPAIDQGSQSTESPQF